MWFVISIEYIDQNFYKYRKVGLKSKNIEQNYILTKYSIKINDKFCKLLNFKEYFKNENICK
jgi:hypothetical protein